MRLDAESLARLLANTPGRSSSSTSASPSPSPPFLLLAAVDHLSVATWGRRWYERQVLRGINPARWWEYSVSASLMVVLIAMLAGVREEAYIVFTVNAFALLGLRALYFLVSGLLDRLVYLSTGLSLILLFIGVKLVLHFLHKQDDAIPEVSIGLSLAVIVAILGVSTVASLIKVRRDPSARAHAGSLRGHEQAETTEYS